jgi:hypothetical protein
VGGAGTSLSWSITPNGAIRYHRVSADSKELIKNLFKYKENVSRETFSLSLLYLDAPKTAEK